jgi:membrane-bound lytic murein transglycosylase A
VRIIAKFFGLVFAACLLVVANEPADAQTPLRSVSTLPGWQQDNLIDWLAAWNRSCQLEPWKGQTERLRDAWKAACRSTRHKTSVSSEWLARNFHVKHLEDKAFVTGYFEPEIKGSREKQAEFPVPLYGMPKNPESIALSRKQIEAGGLNALGLELVWLSNPIDAFFFHIQGSGRVRFADGTSLALGYAGNNGHPYYAIGQDLIASGAISRSAISMQTIAAWLRSHPEAAPEMMQRNPRYIYFKVQAAGYPVGAQGAILVPARSLAVDPKHIPYGLPVWLDVDHPDPASDKRLRRLVIAQDTGGAIRGPGRADLFWGAGDRAAELAGRMRSKGRLYVLWPGRTDP